MANKTQRRKTGVIRFYVRRSNTHLQFMWYFAFMSRTATRRWESMGGRFFSLFLRRRFEMAEYREDHHAKSVRAIEYKRFFALQLRRWTFNSFTIQSQRRLFSSCWDEKKTIALGLYCIALYRETHFMLHVSCCGKTQTPNRIGLENEKARYVYYNPKRIFSLPSHSLCREEKHRRKMIIIILYTACDMAVRR